MRTSEQTKDIASALAKAQAEMPPADKDKRNPHFNSWFSSLEACVAASRPSLTKNGIAVWLAAVLDESVGMVRVTTRLEHSSGQWFESTLSAKPKDMTPQSVGSAITYLKRYGYSAMVGLVSDEDDDGNGSQPEKLERKGNSQLTAQLQAGNQPVKEVLGSESAYQIPHNISKVFQGKGVSEVPHDNLREMVAHYGAFKTPFPYVTEFLNEAKAVLGM